MQLARLTIFRRLGSSDTEGHPEGARHPNFCRWSQSHSAGIFKYYDFFVDTAKDALASFGFNVSLVRLDLILPIGISFYTFHAISYVIDVFRGVLPATRNYSFYITYVIFFPQLVAGPIMRARPMIEQFKSPAIFRYDYAVSGLRLILLVSSRKLLLADNLGSYVDPIYDNVSAHNGAEIALATLCFGMQIYLDFSAYSEIAKGSARLFGIELCDNFQFPYLAENIQDFWRRWHISLTTWFRDYLYKPLGGNRAELASTLINVGIVFIASGLWHGANLTFLAWGHSTQPAISFFYALWLPGGVSVGETIGPFQLAFSRG